MSETTTQPTADAIADATAALDAARATRDTLTTRLAEATEALEAAKATRAALVARTAAGETVSPAALRKADDGLASAEAAAALLREALDLPAADIGRAEAALKAALRAEANRLHAEATQRFFDAAGDLDRAGAAYGQAVQRFVDARQDVERTMGQAGASYEYSLIEILRDQRLIRSAVPAMVQMAIVQTGSVVSHSVEAKMRAALR